MNTLFGGQPLYIIRHPGKGKLPAVMYIHYLCIHNMYLHINMPRHKQVPTQFRGMLDVPDTIAI